jgi:hypothetical protein
VSQSQSSRNPAAQQQNDFRKIPNFKLLDIDAVSAPHRPYREISAILEPIWVKISFIWNRVERVLFCQTTKN